MIPVRKSPAGRGASPLLSPLPRPQRPVPRHDGSTATALRRPPSLLLHPGLPYRARGAPCHTSVIISWELLAGELWWIHLGPPCSGALKGYGQGFCRVVPRLRTTAHILQPPCLMDIRMGQRRKHSSLLSSCNPVALVVADSEHEWEQKAGSDSEQNISRIA